MSNYEKMMIMQRGWRHGAGGTAMDPKCEKHTDKALSTLYCEGYTMGQADRRKANAYAAAKFGITDHEIQMACLR